MLAYSVDLYNESLFLNPRQSDVMVQMAVALSRLERTEEALFMFRAALEIDPENALSYLELGRFYKRMLANEDAEKAFSRSHELNFWSSSTARLNVEQFRSGRGR